MFCSISVQTCNYAVFLHRLVYNRSSFCNHTSCTLLAHYTSAMSIWNFITVSVCIKLKYVTYNLLGFHDTAALRGIYQNLLDGLP